MTFERVAIWGAGAIGGTIGAFLARSGLSTVLIDRDMAHVAAMAERGLLITGPVASFRAEVEAATPERVPGPLDLVLLAVKSQHTEEATRALKPYLASSGAVVSLQNGLNEPTIASVVGPERTIGAFVNFSADVIAPGEIQYGSPGSLVVGELDGRATPRLEALRLLLARFNPNAKLSTNIYGYLWSKQGYGALLKASALTDLSIVDFLAAQEWRAVSVALVREIGTAAEQNGIRLESFDGFDPDAFRPGASAAATERSFEGMIEHNRHSAKTHSGIWRDIAVRKRPTEVAAQLGPVIAAGAAKGVAMPIARELVRLIGEIDAGKRRQGLGNLRILSAATKEPAV